MLSLMRMIINNDELELFPDASYELLLPKCIEIAD
jgi:hypothetical protein